MRLGQLRGVASPGDGYVVRVGAGAMVIRPGADPDTVSQLVDALRDTCAVGIETPGDDLTRRLTMILAARPADAAPVPFAALGQTPTGVSLVISGPLEITLEGEDGVEEFVGEDPAQWVVRTCAGPVRRVALRPVGAGAVQEADPHVDLRVGVTRGEGLALVPPVVTTPPRAREPAAAAEVVGPAAPAGASEPPQASEPAPAVGAAAVAGVAGPEIVTPVEVEGILCGHGHFNDPRAMFCHVCGDSLADETASSVRSERPPLGVLVTDDGRSITLESDCVIGAAPETAELAGGTLLRLADSERGAVSAVHAVVRLDEWDVHLEDRTGVGATYLWDVPHNQWRPMQPGASEVIEPGMVIGIGQRTLYFESYHR